MKKCIRCGVLVVSKVHNRKYCNKCKREVLLERKRRDTKIYYQKYKEKILERSRKYEKEFKEVRQKTYKKYRGTDKYREYGRNRYHLTPENKRKAHYYLRNAVRDGRLKKLNQCENCGKPDWGKKRSMIEAHHYKGYEPQYWLTVQWLCVPCHKHAEEVLLGK